MTTIQRLSALALSAALLLTPVLAAGETQTRAEAARHAAELAMEYGGADSIQYALWEDGGITLSGHAGVYSRTENRALTDEILYGIGSVSKTYTAAAVLKLAEEGRLDLDEPVTTYLPAFRMADARYRDITVRMLLDHSAGLMGDTTRDAFLFDDTDDAAASELLERLSAQRLKADPGEYCVYSNDGYTLAELVVEAVSGMGYMDYVRHALLTPAGLTDTYAPGEDFDTGRLAKTYLSAGDPRALPQDTIGIVGTGGIYATARALASFGGALCGEKLLSRNSLELMNTNWAQRGLWPDGSEDDVQAYGLGWDSVNMFPFRQSGVQALVKGGDTLRYHAALVVLPEHDKAVAVLSSGGSSLYNQLAGARILIDALAEDGVAVDETAALPQAERAEMPEALREYAGTYATLGLISSLSFGEDGALTVTPAAVLGGAAQTFYYYSDGTFRDEGNTALMSFVTEENGRDYLFQRVYVDVPGLTVMGNANYAMERLEPDTAASEEALSAWAERSDNLYVILNEKYTSQVYLSGPFTGAVVVEEAPGYASLDRIVDPYHAEQYLRLPGSGSRNAADYAVEVADGVEYLRVGDYLCMDAAALPDLYAGAGAYSTVQADGLARWYQVGELAGETLQVEVPETGGFWVYDAAGAATASSVAYGDDSAVLPEGGWIVFAGEPGARFDLSLSGGG